MNKGAREVFRESQYATAIHGPAKRKSLPPMLLLGYVALIAAAAALVCMVFLIIETFFK